MELPARLANRVAAWFDQGESEIGLSPREWFDPATVELVVALDRGGPLDGPLGRHARARAAVGLDLRSTIDDLQMLITLLPEAQGRRLDSLTSAASLSEWADEMLGRAVDRGAVDELTGLATPGYLRARLEETYRHCDLLDLSPSRSHALVVFHPLDEPASLFAHMTARLRHARILRSAFPGGESVAITRRGRLIVLSASTSDLQRRAEHAQREIVDPLSLQVHPLPDRRDEGVAMLELMVEERITPER